jgi:hypothetical protein
LPTLSRWLRHQLHRLRHPFWPKGPICSYSFARPHAGPSSIGCPLNKLTHTKKWCQHKADEFRELQQGIKTAEEYAFQFMELSHYAPEEINTDEKKQDMFKKGLTAELRTLMTPQIYPNFNTLMNMAIQTKKAKAIEKKDSKRKFMEQKAH